MKRNTFLKNLGLLLIGSSSLNFKTTPVVPKNKVIIFTPEILKKYNFGIFTAIQSIKFIRSAILSEIRHVKECTASGYYVEPSLIKNFIEIY